MRGDFIISDFIRKMGTFTSNIMNELNIMMGQLSINDFIRKLNYDFWKLAFAPNYLLYASMYFVIILSLIIFFQFSKIQASFTLDVFIYVFLLIVSFLIVFFVIYPRFMKEKSNHQNLILGIVFMIFVFVISFISTTMQPSQFKTMSYVLFLIAIIIFFIGLAIYFYLYSTYLQQQQGVAGFIINFIFFIPCLIIDLIEFIQRDIGMTSRTIYILLFIETVLITIYFVYPLIYNSIVKPGISILPGSKFLNKPKTIVTDTTFLTTPDKELAMRNSIYNFVFPNIDDPGMLPPETPTYAFNSKFSISMWVYLNVQTTSFSSTSEMKIFSYGKGKPSVYYVNNANSNDMDVYRFYFNEEPFIPVDPTTTTLTPTPYEKDETDNTDENVLPNPFRYFEISIPGQKWNNFVLNYNTNEADIFINGMLVHHIDFYTAELPMPSYKATDTISIGSSGLNGAICNITYTQGGLTKNQIITDYNILVNSNPPVSK